MVCSMPQWWVVDAPPVLWLAEPGWAFFWSPSYPSGRTWALHAHSARRPAGHSSGLIRSRAARQSLALALAHAGDAAAVDAELDGGAGAGADQGGADIRRRFRLTGGGPGSATTFIVQFIYHTGFVEPVRLYGIAAAGSLLLALALVALTLLQLRLSKADEMGERAK